MITINGTQVKPTLFPDQTSQVWKVSILDIPDTNFVHVKWTFEHEAEFMHLAQLKNLIDVYGHRATLSLPYLPYGRQDKDISNTSTFALNTFAKLLNSLNFDEVVINDPHSSVAINLIENSVAKFPVDRISSLVKSLGSPIVAYPDAGAIQKYNKLLPHLSFISGSKVRNMITGNITKYEISGPTADAVLIVDDLCDGGATFVLLAKALKERGVKDINLFVSHGIFSKGLKPLKDAGISRIFTNKGEVSEYQNNICYREF